MRNITQMLVGCCGFQLKGKLSTKVHSALSLRSGAACECTPVISP